METQDARAELARLIEERREDYAGLSRMLGRNAAYIQQFIKRGVPRRLAEEDRRKLARYFGVDEAVGCVMHGCPTGALSDLPRLIVIEIVNDPLERCRPQFPPVLQL